MATSKKLYVDGNVGAMFIGTTQVPVSAVSDPTPHLSSLYFHSALDYVQFKQTISATNVTFPARNRESISWSTGGKGGCF